MKTCLVVDDSSVIRKVARRILEGLDFQIVEAEDGEQALEACRRQLPEGEQEHVERAAHERVHEGHGILITAPTRCTRALSASS